MSIHNRDPGDEDDCTNNGGSDKDVGTDALYNRLVRNVEKETLISDEGRAIIKVIARVLTNNLKS